MNFPADFLDNGEGASASERRFCGKVSSRYFPEPRFSWCVPPLSLEKMVSGLPSRGCVIIAYYVYVLSMSAKTHAAEEAHHFVFLRLLT